MCGGKIPEGEISWRFRVRPTQWPKDNRFIHEACVRRLPANLRKRDVQYLEHRLSSLEASPGAAAEKRVLQKAIADRRSDSAASSSGL